jgi:hypothetical protein
MMVLQVMPASESGDSLKQEESLKTRVLFFFGGLLFLLQIVGALPMTSPIKVGQPFPSLTLPRIENGQPGSLSQFRGRKVILQIFASW